MNRANVSVVTPAEGLLYIKPSLSMRSQIEQRNQSLWTEYTIESSMPQLVEPTVNTTTRGVILESIFTKNKCILNIFIYASIDQHHNPLKSHFVEVFS